MVRATSSNRGTSGNSAFDIYTAGQSERNVRRIRTDMAALRATVHQIDWAALLPADGPPEPVELLATA